MKTAITTLALAALLIAQPPFDLQRIQPGAKAPDFEALNSAGRKVTLSQFAGKTVVLVFYRGAWSPYCVAQLTQLRSLLPDSHKSDTVLLAVSVESPAKLREMESKVAPAVTLLADPAHKVTDQYGLRNMEAARMGRYEPLPATFLVDPRGIVRWKFTDANYRIRPSNEMIRKELEKIWHAGAV